MQKKGQNLPVRGLYEIGISLCFWTCWTCSKMKLKIVQTENWENCENAIFLQKSRVLQQMFFNEQMAIVNKNSLFFK